MNESGSYSVTAAQRMWAVRAGPQVSTGREDLLRLYCPEHRSSALEAKQKGQGAPGLINNTYESPAQVGTDEPAIYAGRRSERSIRINLFFI